MSAHPALFMVDVLSEIFEWYDSRVFMDEFSVTRLSERTTTLAQSARVCKSFHQAAIRVLWRSPHGFFPVLKLLPSLRQVVGVDGKPFADGGYEIYYFPADIPQSEWDRMLQHSFYVETLQAWEYDRGATLTPTSWSTLDRFAKVHRIFPNMRWINWSVELSQPPSILGSLCEGTTGLRGTFHCDSTANSPDEHTRVLWHSHLERLLAAICSHTSRLLSLRFDIGDLSPSAVVPQIPALASLLEFTLSSGHGSVDLSHMQGLASMPALDTISFSSTVTGAFPVGLDPSDSFRSLEDLSLGQWDANSAIFSCPSLKRFGITDYAYRGAHILRGHCKTWADSFPRLEKFTCYMRTANLEDDDRRHSFSSVIDPLFSLCTLQHVAVSYSTFIPFSVEDADIVNISEAWPSLVHLDIYEASLDTDYPSCTAGLPGLLALARNCPHLTTLSLRRLSIHPEDLSTTSAESVDHGLQQLTVPHGITDDIRKLLASRMFPHLQVNG
ncbi:hypothetical protein OH77DRAFT_1520510 [Trametes cingulata]|nr:hypothetical protein OH77DRAFT_1520510 [Trametes cingulata]